MHTITQGVGWAVGVWSHTCLPQAAVRPLQLSDFLTLTPFPSFIPDVMVDHTCPCALGTADEEADDLRLSLNSTL